MDNENKIGIDSQEMNKRNLTAILGVTLAVLGVSSWCLFDFSVQNVVLYKSPYTSPLQPGLGSQPLVERLIIVLIEGFEPESFERMLTTRDIANRGVAVSLSGGRGLAPVPASVALMTGASPEVSGVVTNWHDAHVMVDSLFSSALRSGLNIAIVGDAKWRPLFGDTVTRSISYDEDDCLANVQANDAILADALIEIKQDESRLVLVSFLPERRLLHSLTGMKRDGITREEAEAGMDTRLNRLLDSIDLSSTAIVVAASHSVLSQGGTTAGFPGNKTQDLRLVAGGAGILRSGDLSEVTEWIPGRLVDVAPTMACLLGIAVPFHSQGEAMFQVLDMPPHVLSERAIRQTAARIGFAGQYLNVQGLQANEDWSLFDAFLLHNDGKYESAYENAVSLDNKITAALEGVRSRLVRSSRPVSIPLLGLVMGLLVCISARLLQDSLKDAFIAAMGMFGYFTAYYGLLIVRGIPLSSSIILSKSQFAWFYYGRVLDSVASLIIMAIIVGWPVYHRGRLDVSANSLSAGFVSCSFIALTLVVQIGVFLASEGFAYNRYLPDMQECFRYLVYLVQLMVVGVLAPISAGLSQGMFLLASRRRLKALS